MEEVDDRFGEIRKVLGGGGWGGLSGGTHSTCWRNREEWDGDGEMYFKTKLGR